MKVYILPDWMNEEANFQSFNRIFAFFEEKKHWLCINTEEELDAIKTSAWFLSLHISLQKIYADILDNAFDRSADDTSNPHIFSEINHLYYCLNEPLYLIVENQISDVAFLHTIIRCFAKQSKKIKEALSQRPAWIQFRHSGGKGQMTQIAQNLKAENPQARIFIFRDSDKRFPTNENSDVRDLADFCNRIGIDLHILLKREIENYLPLDALATLPHKQEVFEAYLQLNPAQQDYYDMEKGFGGKNEIPHNCEGLWDNLDRKSPDFQHLRSGFCEGKGKDELTNLFRNKEIITTIGLLERCKSTEENELKDLLSNIAKAL